MDVQTDVRDDLDDANDDQKEVGKSEIDSASDSGPRVARIDLRRCAGCRAQIAWNSSGAAGSC